MDETAKYPALVVGPPYGGVKEQGPGVYANQLAQRDIAHSRAFSETAFAAAAEPKELFIVDGARHIDLYDDVTKIPFDKMENFFKENLK